MRIEAGGEGVTPKAMGKIDLTKDLSVVMKGQEEAEI